MAPQACRPIALVTGAASGIGAEYAHQLSGRGFDLVLVDRDSDRLAAVSKELTTKSEMLVADLSTAIGRQPVVDRLHSGVQLLVNCAGFGFPGAFWEVPPERLQAELDVAVTTVLHLTRAALPTMVSAGKGDVISVASFAGLVAGPAASYSAAKAYIVFLTEGLAKSLSGSGVRVQAVCPGFVRTRFHESAGFDMSRLPKRMWLTTEKVVATSLDDLDAGKTVSIPGLQYKVLVTLARLTPRRLTERAAPHMIGRRREPTASEVARP